MKFLKKFRLILVGLISLFMLLVSAHPLTANNTNPSTLSSEPPRLDQLYQPRVFPMAFVPDLQMIERASKLINNVPNKQSMKFPIPSDNPRDNLAIEGSIDHAKQEAIPITTNQVDGMFEREIAIMNRNSTNGFSMEQKQNSVLLASMDLNNLAQYESCVYVDAYGSVRDGCYIDLVVRDLNSGKRWIYPRVLIDQFCVHVVKSILNGTWF